MNTKLIISIYENLKKYVRKKKPSYDIRVTRKSQKIVKDFPLIVMKLDDYPEIRKTTQGSESISKAYITIEIFTRDLIKKKKKIPDVIVAEELSELVDKVLGKMYGMNRTECKPTPNLDDSIYRITMKYTKNILENKNLLLI